MEPIGVDDSDDLGGPHRRRTEMPALEVRYELNKQQQEHEDQEDLDDAVEARGGRVGRRIGGGDAAVGGADEADEGIGDGGEEGGDLLEFQEPEPGDLAGAPGTVLADRPIGSGAADLDGEYVTGGIVVEEEAVFGVGLSLLVPPFLKLVVVRRRRHV